MSLKLDFKSLAISSFTLVASARDRSFFTPNKGTVRGFDSRAFVATYFKKLGYRVELTKEWNKHFHFKRGVPVLVCFKGSDRFFVDVKNPVLNQGLSFDEINFIAENPLDRFVVVYVFA